MTTTRLRASAAAPAGAAQVKADGQELSLGRRTSARVASASTQHAGTKPAPRATKGKGTGPKELGGSSVAAVSKSSKRVRERANPQPDPKEEEAAKRPCGRPRKTAAPAEPVTQKGSKQELEPINYPKPEPQDEKAAARPRGRPRKSATAAELTLHKGPGQELGAPKEQRVPQSEAAVDKAVARPRGRPRKSAAAAELVPEEVNVQPVPLQQPTPALNASKSQPEPEPPSKRTRRSGRFAKAGVASTADAPGPINRADDGFASAVAAAAAEPPTAEATMAGNRTSPTAPSSSQVQMEPLPTTTGAATAPAVVPDPSVVLSHQLQQYSGSIEPVHATVPAAAPGIPLSPRPQQPLLCRSPQKRVPSPVNAPDATKETVLAAAAVTAGYPKAAPLPRPAPDSPKAAAATTIPVAPVAAVRPDGALSDAELTQIRRLLMPGALASTLASRAAATSAIIINDGTAAATAAAAADTGSGDGAGSAPSVELAGRTGQFKELCSLVSECCCSGRGTAVYISGLPGTGKTYTVSRLLAALPTLAGSCSHGAGRTSFCCATLNCMTLDDPAQLYGRLQNELLRAAAAADSGKGCTQSDIPDVPTPTDATAAHESLVSTLSKLSLMRPTMVSGVTSKGLKAATKGSRSKSAKRGRDGAEDAPGHEDEPPMRRVFVVVLDEVDRLLRRRDGGEELARLFQLPTTPGLSLVLLSVANSLDLTERMMPLLRARGMAPRHLVFTAYNRPQVLAILSAQLSAQPRGRRCFDDAALDMVAKSVSSSSGDLRQALKACRTALDILMEHNRANPANARASVGIREVHAALQRMSSQGNGQPAVVAKIKGLPPQQQLVLLALATAVGAKATAAGGEGGGGMFQPGSALFTGSRPKFADAVAFREIGNHGGPLPAASCNPGACFEGPTPSKPGRPDADAAAAATPSASRVRGVMCPGGAAALTPSSCARGPPPSRTPASILAGDAGLALSLAEVYIQYGTLCRQLDIPAMSESAFRTDALVGLDCDGLLRVTEGRTPAATRLSLRVMVRDVQAALADNVMFKRLMGAKAPPPAGTAVAAAGVVRA